jgi:enoyl-[acyl-carrier protein] reductase II
MSTDLLREHVRKAKAASRAPFGVNIPLSRGDAEELVRATVEEGVRIVFTSSGHPAKYTQKLKDAGCIVVHVIAAVKHGTKAAEAGCDAVVAEGFEAGGHNGVDELTTLALVPQVVDAISLPVIAAGGIADGRGLAAVLALGAQAAQVGTRFAATVEASSHETYKNAIVLAGDTDTVLTMKQVVPVRMLKTPFTKRVQQAEREGADKAAMLALLGEKRERRGIFEGNLEEGMFEAGQGAGLVREILPAAEVVRRMMEEYHAVKGRMP